jgi:hypothetical protein
MCSTVVALAGQEIPLVVVVLVRATDEVAPVESRNEAIAVGRAIRSWISVAGMNRRLVAL